MTTQVAYVYVTEEGGSTGRDNTFNLSLMEDGSSATAGVATRAGLHIPGNAFTDGNPMFVDTDSAYAELIESATKVKYDLAELPGLKTGRYDCKQTVFDATNTDGLAWPVKPVTVRVVEWPADVSP